tara:strand:+ start:118 stop:1275 length:1158 start_codon:yes stop_codon:yes gene_type:complete
MSIFSLKGYSQGCPTSGYPAYYYCSDIAQFVANYPGCSRLPSTLILPYGGVSNLANFPALSQIDSISGNLICDECDLSSLVGLENLNYVGGSVTINEPHGTLVNLQGLNNLSYIGENFNLYECDDLVSTNGLDNLLYIGNRIWLHENPVLIQITGFENISHLPGEFWLDEMDALIDLSGFDSLINIGSRVRIWDNALLSSLEGFNNVELIDGYLDISYNDKLIHLDALENLNTVGGVYLNVRGNDILDNIEGLSSIVNFNGEITIYDNNQLTSLDGIENIDADSITNLYILKCDSLSICSQPNICQYLINSIGPSTINLNNTGCNSILDIQNQCNSTSINTIDRAEIKILIKIIDILGRESQEIKNKPLFYIYNDGTVEKKIIIE